MTSNTHTEKTFAQEAFRFILSDFEALRRATSAFVRFLYDLTRKRTAWELLEAQRQAQILSPARKALTAFEVRIKQIRCGQATARTAEEREWEVLPRKRFYSELIELYERHGFNLDCVRLVKESESGAKRTKDVKDADGVTVGTETEAEGNDYPLTVELSMKRK